MLQTNTLTTQDGAIIVIQSCERTLANVGIFSGGLCSYCHVHVPDLARYDETWKSNHISKAQFDAVLEENRERIVDLVNRLANDS